MTDHDSEMMFAEAFRLGGVVARIRSYDHGTCDSYDVLISFENDDSTIAIIDESQLADLADAAKAASHMIRHFDDECSLVKLAELLHGYAVERLDNDPTPAIKENTQ